MIGHIIDEGGWIVFITAVFIGLSMHAFLSDRLIYDNTLPISNLREISVTESVKPGGMFRYTAGFDKRAGCKVTKGGYNIVGTADRGEYISLLNIVTVTTGTWPTGKNQTAVSGVQIPQNIPPGNYHIWWRYCWQCEGARRELCVPLKGWQATSVPVRVEAP